MSRSADLRLQRTYYVDGKFIFNLDKYYQLLAFQKGGCAICGKKPSKIRLAVDHSHISGLLRGLLCFRCNKAFGLFHDEDSARLRKAADYLDKPPFIQLFGVRYTAGSAIGTKKRAKLLAKMKGNRG